MRRLMVAAGLLVFAVAQAGAQGDPGRGGPPDGRGGGRGGRGGPGGAQMEACRFGADSLTDVQKQQVDQFAKQFEAANKTTLDSLRALGPGGGRGRGGRGGGQGATQEQQLTKEQMDARMAAVRTLQESLKPAHQWWIAQMQQVLTKNQLEKGCVPPPPGAPPGGRRGGPPPDGDRR